MTIQEIDTVANVIQEKSEPGSSIIFGAQIDSRITNKEVSKMLLFQLFFTVSFHGR